jgi:hypothetical protein
VQLCGRVAEVVLSSVAGNSRRFLWSRLVDVSVSVSLSPTLWLTAGNSRKARIRRRAKVHANTDDGGYLTWWKTTGTITFHCPNLAAKKELRQAFIAVASARKRLLGEYNGRVFCGRLRSLYADWRFPVTLPDTMN